MSLTTGEKRYIGEASNTWARTILDKARAKGEVSFEEEKKAYDMAEEYETAFLEYFSKARAEGDNRDNAYLKKDFDELYKQKRRVL